MKYAISISKMFLGILLITLSISLPAASAQTASSREFYPSSIDWNSAQDLIAVGDEGGQVEIIDLSTNTQILNTQIGDQRINKLLWHPSGNQLAGAAGGQVVVWDKIGNTLQTLKPAYAQERYYALVWNVQLDQLLTHSEAAERGYVDYWDIPSGQSVKRERSGTLLDMQMSPDGTVFAVANVINIILRDPLSFEPKSKITQTVRGGLGYDIVIFTWSPDSTQIATGSINGTVRLWDVASGQMLLDLRASDNPVKEGPPSYVYDLRFSPDGKQLMSVRADGTLRLWDTQSGAVLQEQVVANVFSAAAISAYGAQVAYGVREATVPSVDATSIVAPRQILTDAGVAIVVPFASIEKVRVIGQQCAKDTTATFSNSLLAVSSLERLSNTSLPDFITQIQALPEDAIPPACAADLIAVAEAVIAQQ